jgi:uncharacterized protein YeaO (DUF488 family)
MEMHMKPARLRSRGARRPIYLKRVYEVPSPHDGLRVLVDRLWPRGLTRHQASADLWLKDVAPSAALRGWYGHEPARWSGFARKYRAELKEQRDLLRMLDDLRRRGPLTLLFGAREGARSHALVLRDVLEEGKLKRTCAPRR